MDPRIQWSVIYMEQNMHHRMSIRELAAQVNLSYRHFVRLFRAEIGLSPVQYLKKLRVRNAKGLLEHTFLSVKQIAVRVGMDQSHFVRDFHRALGSSPGLHRATVNHRLQLAVESKIFTLNVTNGQRMSQMANEFPSP